MTEGAPHTPGSTTHPREHHTCCRPYLTSPDPRPKRHTHLSLPFKMTAMQMNLILSLLLLVFKCCICTARVNSSGFQVAGNKILPKQNCHQERQKVGYYGTG